MTFQLKLNARSNKQYQNIVDWYMQRSKQAAEIFITELEKTFDRIIANPFRYRNRYKHFREILMKKYPYYVIYFINENEGEIVIFSIYHTARNPKTKYN